MMAGGGASKRQWVTVAALVVSVFMAGALTAAAVLQVLEGREEPAAAAGRRGPGPGRAVPGPGPAGRPGPHERPRPPFAMARILQAELELTADQRARIDAILERRRERSGEIVRDLRGRLRAQVDSAQAAIEEMLTPEQRERFRELRARQRWGPRRDDGPGRLPER